MLKPISYNVGVYLLEAPAIDGFAFIGKTGWIGARCSCGFIASGRSLAALEMALADHQEPVSCPAFAQFRAQEAEEV